MPKAPCTRKPGKNWLPSTLLPATAPPVFEPTLYSLSFMNISSFPLLFSSLSLQPQLSSQLPQMKYSPSSQTLVPRLHTANPRQYLLLSIIQPLEGADTLLSEAGRLAKAVIKSSDKDDFYNTLLNDFVEAKTTWKFLDKEFLSDKDLDQNSD